MRERTGLCQIYSCWSEGFSGRLRPCYDSAPIAKAEMTDHQVRTLQSMIARYMTRCQKRNRREEGMPGGKTKL